MHIDTDDDSSPETKETPLPTNQRTVGNDKDDREKIRMGSYGPSHSGNGRTVSLSGFDTKEFDRLEGAMHNHYWITVDNGRLRAIPTYKELPGPLEDEMMRPFWRPPVVGVETQLELFNLQPMPDYCSPSIIIQNLCGYNYTPEGYVAQATKLQYWGFECLRSRRDLSGRFHEVWLLPSLYSAEHDLRAAIEKSTKKSSGIADKKREAKQLEAAVSFLCCNASFGTLDATLQRAAMMVD